MPVWMDLEEKLGKMPSTHPSRLRYLDRVNFYGQVAELDAQGRVLIPVRLRETATMNGDVDVLGQLSYLDIWNHERFLTKLQREPFTDDDARALSEFGIWWSVSTEVVLVTTSLRPRDFRAATTEQPGNYPRRQATEWRVSTAGEGSTSRP